MLLYTALLLWLAAPSSEAFLPSSLYLVPRRYSTADAHLAHGELHGYSSRQHRRRITQELSAKRRKNKDEDSSEDQWYDDISTNASPEDVFWEEMERRRLLNQSYDAGAGEGAQSPIDMVSMIGDASSGMGRSGGSSGGSSAVSSTNMAATIAAQSSAMGDDYYGAPSANNAMSIKNPGVTIAEERSAEAALASYASNAVSDNYLFNDEDDEEQSLKAMRLRNDPSLWQGEDPTLEEENAELDKQLDELERELFGDGVDGSVVGGSSPYFDVSLSDEPWDRYGKSKTEKGENESAFHKELERKMAVVNKSAKEFTLDDNEDPEEAIREEEEYVQSLSSIGITSRRLENAAVNPKAEAFFKRAPDERQGYDTMWVSAIEQPCIQNLYGVFSNFGVQFVDNFDDWEYGTEEDETRSIEEIASFKARKVFQVTGIPCIASRTSFEVEPIRPEDLDKVNEEYAATAPVAGGKKTKAPTKSPRVVTGYRFNDVGEHVDHVVQALIPFSEPTRVTRFRSCVCYYDGEMEIFESGELDCDLYFSGSMRTFIPMSAAINSMLKSLELALDLQFQKWLHSKVNDATKGGSYSDVSIKLRDRVLKEAKVLPNEIIDVSSFMDAFVDVDLMDECGKELAERFIPTKPSKILTIATTGLVIAIRELKYSVIVCFPHYDSSFLVRIAHISDSYFASTIAMAKYLQVPLVYARKQRSIVMADTFDAGYNSKTVGRDRQLLVSRDHIDEDDRVLIVDDFLSSGSSQEALLRIISEAGATAVGVGVLLEKEYEAGRKSLSGFGVPVESLVRIASVRDGVIQLLEEDGYAKM